MDGAPIGAPPPFARFPFVVFRNGFASLGREGAPRERLVIASASEAIRPDVSRWIASSLSLLAMTVVCLVLASERREHCPQ
jgi:hypothetical protein